MLSMAFPATRQRKIILVPRIVVDVLVCTYGMINAVTQFYLIWTLFLMSKVFQSLHEL